MKVDITLYLVTDSTDLAEDQFLKKVEEACIGGVSIIQLREKKKSTRDYLTLAQKVKQITDHYRIPLIIDDRIDIALAIDASGVHVGSEDMPVCLARRLMGENKIVGATTKDVEAAKKAEDEGADYLGVGAIYPTATKVKTKITSVETLKDICNSVRIPVGAIGGLTADNCDVLKGIPIAGVCVVSAIMKQMNSEHATRILKRKLADIIR